MDNVKLKAEKTVKFLGAMFDNKLTFDEHIKDKINNTRQKKYKIPKKKL